MAILAHTWQSWLMDGSFEERIPENFEELLKTLGSSVMGQQIALPLREWIRCMCLGAVRGGGTAGRTAEAAQGVALADWCTPRAIVRRVRRVPRSDRLGDLQ